MAILMAKTMMKQHHGIRESMDSPSFPFHSTMEIHEHMERKMKLYGKIFKL
jgi:hypothetical protein